MEDNNEIAVPFDMSYVLKTTARHMRKDIDVSIRKTFGRIEEFAHDRQKSEEIFKTLSFLHQMRAELDAFQLKYADSFKRV